MPSPGDPGVHYYGPGTHEVGRLRVGSNETVYIAGGARFIGTIEGEEVENVTVRGRGVLDGSVHTTWDDRIFALVFDRSRNIKVEGIRIREAYWWVTEFLLCEQVEIDHLFIFSNHRNNGGIMVDGCSDLTVRNSFFIIHDDCICPHALITDGSRPEPKTLSPAPLPAADSPEELIIDNASPKFRAVGFNFDDACAAAYGRDVHRATVPQGFSSFKAAIYGHASQGNTTFTYTGAATAIRRPTPAGSCAMRTVTPPDILIRTLRRVGTTTGATK